MKSLLFSQRIIENQSYPEIREALDIRWGEFAKVAGFLPLPLCINSDYRAVFDKSDTCGLVLTGGNDINSLNADPINKMRDEFESELLQIALSKRLPVLGVCRGLQFLAHYFGSDLRPCEGHSNTNHLVKFNRDSFFYQFYGDHTQVNSYHNFALGHLSNTLIPAGFSETDQSVEAIEYPEKAIYAIMWHPERFENPRVQDLMVFKEIFRGR